MCVARLYCYKHRSWDSTTVNEKCKYDERKYTGADDNLCNNVGCFLVAGPTHHHSPNSMVRLYEPHPSYLQISSSHTLSWDIKTVHPSSYVWKRIDGCACLKKETRASYDHSSSRLPPTLLQQLSNPISLMIDGQVHDDTNHFDGHRSWSWGRALEEAGREYISPSPKAHSCLFTLHCTGPGGIKKMRDENDVRVVLWSSKTRWRLPMIGIAWSCVLQWSRLTKT